MEIKACSKCGSIHLSLPAEHELEIRLSLAGQYKCMNCGNIGFPILFDSEEDYKKFLNSKDDRDQEH